VVITDGNIFLNVIITVNSILRNVKPVSEYSFL